MSMTCDDVLRSVAFQRKRNCVKSSDSFERNGHESPVRRLGAPVLSASGNMHWCRMRATRSIDM
jgi:hypothetical protein